MKLKDVLEEIEALKKETIKEFTDQGQGGYRYLSKLEEILIKKYDF